MSFKMLENNKSQAHQQAILGFVGSTTSRHHRLLKPTKKRVSPQKVGCKLVQRCGSGDLQASKEGNSGDAEIL